MKSSSYGTYPRSAYPGKYIPLFNTEEIKEELKKPDEGIAAEPLVNLIEEEDYCKIEAAMPGLQREDFVIKIDRNILSITVVQKESPTFAGNGLQREFDYHSFNRHIILPENVETEFIRAEYKEGVLTMYLLKTGCSAKSAPLQVVVY